MENFARMFFLHQIAEGKPLDVIADHPEIQSLIEWAEKEELIEVDVKGACYKLTEKGRELQQSQIAEAQDLIRRYDIYGDVDMDSAGKARFDTGLGYDFRVPIWEMEGIDPFRARLLLGMNDGEWKDADWPALALNESFYDETFAPIEAAAATADVGEEKLRAIMEQAKRILRDDPTLSALSEN